MATLEVDFNAQDVDGRVRLTTVGSLASLAQTGAKLGDWVWLTDGDLRVGGHIEEDQEGLRALVAWETLEYLLLEDDERNTPEQYQAAVEQFGQQIHSARPDYQAIVRVLPLLEHNLPPGESDAIRARAALAFGYPRLALLALEDALRADPTAEEWICLRRDLLGNIDQAQSMCDVMPGRSDVR